jgi:hypothetical protein
MSNSETTEQVADVAGARKALKKFLAAYAEADYRTALKHVQTSWIHMHTPNPVEQLKKQMAVVVISGYTITEYSADESPAEGQVPEVFSDCMVDLPFRLQVRAHDRGYDMTGVARVICERGYMKPSPKGKWGVNPISMARGDRRAILPE